MAPLEQITGAGYQSPEERVHNLPQTNEVIGANFPAGARIHLYSFLDRLKENAIYCDTDFVLFIQPSAETCPIVTGDKLEDMQPILKHSEYIIEFRSGGPKIYAYRVITMKKRKLYVNFGLSL